MLLPIKAKILGKEFKIKYQKITKWDRVEVMGLTFRDLKTIKISLNLHDNAEELYATLFHELLHAALSVPKLDSEIDEELEERIIICLENAIAPLIDFKNTELFTLKEIKTKWE